MTGKVFKKLLTTLLEHLSAYKRSPFNFKGLSQVSRYIYNKTQDMPPYAVLPHNIRVNWHLSSGETFTRKSTIDPMIDPMEH